MLASLLKLLFKLSVVDTYYCVDHVLEICGSVFLCDIVLDLFLESLVEQCC